MSFYDLHDEKVLFMKYRKQITNAFVGGYKKLKRKLTCKLIALVSVSPGNVKSL